MTRGIIFVRDRFAFKRWVNVVNLSSFSIFNLSMQGRIYVFVPAGAFAAVSTGADLCVCPHAIGAPADGDAFAAIGGYFSALTCFIGLNSGQRHLFLS
jgi:hypothetical protein